MRLIKAFLVGFICLFVIITLFSALIPSQVRVSRGVLISNTNSGEVYRLIAQMENWKKWHPIFTVDLAGLNDNTPALLTGKDPEFHILYGKNDVTIILVSADSGSVKFLLQAKGENDIDNDIVVTALPLQKAVQVEWRAITRLGWYPWEKLYGIFIDKITGPGYEAALNGLKIYLEGRPAVSTPPEDHKPGSDINIHPGML